ncbi:MAG: DJ-1/PfpI family protein [Clostridia bacterium]|nr:DJ-1/PfpI family protein [Clostridia bacterium]
MLKILVLFANGTEEIEGLTPVDVLRRAGVDCDLVSVSGTNPIGSHNISVKADKVIEEITFSDYDGVVIPGGMPGAVNISNNKKVIDGIKEFLSSEKLVCAICASPAVVLANNNLLNAESATCYPAPQFVSALGDKYTGKDVEVCNNIITANGPKSAMVFSLAICDYLKVKPKF